MNDFVIQAINDCRNNASLAQEIIALYARLEHEQDAGDVRVRCLGGGTCCRFDRLGHRLWASCGEIALLLGTSPQPGANGKNVMSPTSQTPTYRDRGPLPIPQLQPDRCPWQLGARCLARHSRPLGCRVYFCQKQYDNYFHELYETYHDLIRAAHQRHCATYAYVDVLSALLQLSAT
jgi:hypothetical protein